MSTDYPRLPLKAKRERSLLNRHPWIFSGGPAKKPALEPGAIVEVVSADGTILGYAHYNPESPIIARVFHFGKLERNISAAFWQEKFLQAVAFRESLPELQNTNAYRLINAEGDGLPGVIVDRFGDTAVLQIRTPGPRALVPQLQGFLQNELDIPHVFDKSKPEGEEEIGGWLTDAPEAIEFHEHGIHFRAPVESGQKTGFFLDQRANRQLLRRYAEGRNVLDVFAYSGAFSMQALMAGANSVVAVDSSEAAIELFKAHVQRNFPDATRYEGRAVDAFDHLRKLAFAQHDLIILDPPAFTKSNKTVKKAARGYKDINLNAIKRIAPGGILFTFSCSQHVNKELFRKIVFGAAADAGRHVRLVHDLGQPADHAYSIFHPEGEYLKGLVLQVE